MSSRPCNAAPLGLMLSRQLIEAEKQRRRSAFVTLFPDTGPFGREHYPKHMEFFAAGADFKERLFMAANRVGKTVAGAYETTCHLTGRYPEWWQGRRFDHATDGWACGANSQTTRDVVQGVLLGKSTGQGMIPVEAIVDSVAGRGITGSIETLWVRHNSGGTSRLGFKTYEQGRRAFEGEAKHFIWCDEEPPMDVYVEMLYRLLTTKGLAWTTFTPLLGMSEVVTSFLEAESEESRRSRYFVQAGWKDVPHLDAEERRKLTASTPPYQIRARTEGEPALGSGAIYPISEEDITCDTFPIDQSWRRVFAMDVGWNRTAVLWGAENPGNGQIVIYDEHYQSQGEPASHAMAIRARGEWIPGVIDPACLGSSQIDGRKLMEMYTGLGLDLAPAVNAVETGITEVWQALVAGRIKVQRHLANFFREFRKYHRNDKGQIVERDDHLMDCLRYLWLSGRARLALRPEPQRRYRDDYSHIKEDRWMLR